MVTLPGPKGRAVYTAFHTSTSNSQTFSGSSKAMPVQISRPFFTVAAFAKLHLPVANTLLTLANLHAQPKTHDRSKSLLTSSF
jgi:hypothetical protein